MTETYEPTPVRVMTEPERTAVDDSASYGVADPYGFVPAPAPADPPKRKEKLVSTWVKTNLTTGNGITEKLLNDFANAIDDADDSDGITDTLAIGSYNIRNQIGDISGAYVPGTFERKEPKLTYDKDTGRLLLNLPQTYSTFEPELIPSHDDQTITSLLSYLIDRDSNPYKEDPRPRHNGHDPEKYLNKDTLNGDTIKSGFLVQASNDGVVRIFSIGDRSLTKIAMFERNGNTFTVARQQNGLPYFSTSLMTTMSAVMNSYDTYSYKTYGFEVLNPLRERLMLRVHVPSTKSPEYVTITLTCTISGGSELQGDDNTGPHKGVTVGGHLNIERADLEWCESVGSNLYQEKKAIVFYRPVSASEYQPRDNYDDLIVVPESDSAVQPA